MNTADMNQRPLWAWGDSVVFFCIVLVIVYSLFSRTKPEGSVSSFEIWSDDSLLITDSLHGDTIVIPMGNDSAMVLVSDSSIRISESTCRAQVCVHTGEISEMGEEIICLPFKMIVKLSGERESDADIIAR